MNKRHFHTSRTKNGTEGFSSVENLFTCDWFWQEFCATASPTGQWLATDTASTGSCCNLTKIVVKILIGLLECDTGSHWMTRVFSKSLEKSIFVITFHIQKFETKSLKNMRALNCQKSLNLKLEWSPWPEPDQNIKWGSVSCAECLCPSNYAHGSSLALKGLT